MTTPRRRKELLLDHNMLEALPNSGVRAVRVMTPLTCVAVGRLNDLVLLHINANQLASLPASVVQLSKLRHFKVVLNPWAFGAEVERACCTCAAGLTPPIDRCAASRGFRHC